MSERGDHPITAQPVEIALQHLAVLDCPHYPIIEVTGRDRVDLLHRLSTNDLLSSGSGQTVHTALLNEKGRLVDYITLLIRNSSILALASKENEEGFISWIEKFTIMEDVHVRSRRGDLALSSLIGPHAFAALGRVFMSIPEPGRFLNLGSEDSPIIISRRSDFGASRFDLIASRQEIDGILNRMASGEGALPRIDDDGWQTYRILHGIPAFRHEIALSFNPLETRLDQAISRAKGCYIGQEIIARLETYKKVQRRLAGIILPAGPSHFSIPASLYREDGTDAGVLTSVVKDPFRGCTPALGVVKTALVKNGDMLRVFDPHTGPIGMVTDLPMTFDVLRDAENLLRVPPYSAREQVVQ